MKLRVSSKIRHVLLLLVCVFLLAAVTACSASSSSSNSTNQDAATTNDNDSGASGNDSKAAEQLQTVKLGTLKSLGNSSFYLGDEKGIFQKHGIKLEFVPFESAQPIAVAAQTGDIDVGSTAFTAGFFNLFLKGDTAIRVVADGSKEWPGYNGSALLVSKGAYDSGVKSIKDLKGKKIGVTQVGSSLHYMAGQLLEQEGLSIKDVEIVPLGKVGNIAAALESNQVDAGVLLSTAAAPLIAKDKAKLITWVGDKVKIQLSGVFFSKKMLENKDLAERFLMAYIESVRYYHDTVLTAKDKNDPAYKEAIAILSKRTDIPEDKVPENLPYIDRNAELWLDNLSTWVNWFKNNGLLEGDLDVSTVANTELYQQALQKVGK
ncbi:ABC transporter substrate-binding protein [Bacillaceae bacterium]